MTKVGPVCSHVRCLLCLSVPCRNKAKALRVLHARLFEAERRKQAASTSAERRASIGSGDRHERIRTYNFPQVRG